jgi:hypothetical protein
MHSSNKKRFINATLQNRSMLKDDEYCTLIINTIEAAQETSHTKDPRVLWEFIKFRIREVDRQFCKKRAAERREDRAKLEAEYAYLLKSGNPDIIEVKAKLQKHYQNEDDIIIFRAAVEEAEGDEKISPFFFRKILTNRQDSNVNKLTTEKYPGGTQTREETIKALEAHYKDLFADKDENVRLGDEWWNGLKGISDTTKEELDRCITKNDLTRMVYKEMSTGKSPGDDGLPVEFYRKFWVSLVNPLMNCMEEC